NDVDPNQSFAGVKRIVSSTSGSTSSLISTVAFAGCVTPVISHRPTPGGGSSFVNPKSSAGTSSSVPAPSSPPLGGPPLGHSGQSRRSWFSNPEPVAEVNPAQAVPSVNPSSAFRSTETVSLGVVMLSRNTASEPPL